MYEYCWCIRLYNNYVTFKLLFSVTKLRRFESIFKKEDDEEEQQQEQEEED